MSVQAIDRIQPLWTDLQTEGMRLDAGAEVGGTRRTQPTLFSDIFQSAIDRVRETDAAKNEVAYQLGYRANWTTRRRCDFHHGGAGVAGTVDSAQK